MSELLPCPFCGSTQGLDYFEGTTFRWRTAECVECGASPGEVRYDTLATNHVEAENEARIRLHEVWNTRTNQPDPISTPRPTDCADIREGRVTVLARDQKGEACMTMVKR